MPKSKPSARLPGCLHCALRDTMVRWREEFMPKDEQGMPVIDGNLEIEKLAEFVGEAVATGSRGETTASLATYMALLNQLALSFAIAKQASLEYDHAVSVAGGVLDAMHGEPEPDPNRLTDEQYDAISEMMVRGIRKSNAN